MNTKEIKKILTPTKKKRHPFWSIFWLTFLVVSLWYAWYSFYAPDNDIVWKNNLESAQNLASNNDKNVMIFFTAEWCSPCRIMKRQVFADNDVMKAINAKVVSVEIDIDDPMNEEIVKRYNIRATPVTIFTDPKGKVIDYGVGKIEKVKFLEMLLDI